MTEEEAKAKWCPFIREIQFENDLSLNRMFGDAHYNCIGSKCMSWRSIPEIDNMKVVEDQRITAAGYCGLAGKP